MKPDMPTKTQSRPSLDRMVRRGEVSATLFDGEACIKVGMPIEVARYCCDSPVGNRGVVHGWRHTPRGIKIVVNYGRNAGGQRLLKPYPANVLRVAPNAPAETRRDSGVVLQPVVRQSGGDA